MFMALQNIISKHASVHDKATNTPKPKSQNKKQTKPRQVFRNVRQVVRKCETSEAAQRNHCELPEEA